MKFFEGLWNSKIGGCSKCGKALTVGHTCFFDGSEDLTKDVTVVSTSAIPPIPVVSETEFVKRRIDEINELIKKEDGDQQTMISFWYKPMDVEITERQVALITKHYLRAGWKKVVIRDLFCNNNWQFVLFKTESGEG